MGNASSILTQYDIEDVQEHCHYLFSQQEIVALYERFCQLDRNSKGYITSDEFLSIPEFSLNPLSHRLVQIVDGLNFKDFVAFLSNFSQKATIQQKIECNELVLYLSEEVIFKVYDADGKGKVTFKDILEVLRSLTGSFMTEEQREQVLSKLMKEAGYERDSSLSLEDFTKILTSTSLKMEVEVPID